MFKSKVESQAAGDWCHCKVSCSSQRAISLSVSIVTVKCYPLNKVSTPLHAFITVYLCLYQVHVIPRHVSLFSSYVYLQLVLCFDCYDNSGRYLQVHRISRVRTSFSRVSPFEPL